MNGPEEEGFGIAFTVDEFDDFNFVNSEFVRRFLREAAIEAKDGANAFTAQSSAD